LEVITNHLAAANTNPFTGQQQTQDWQNDYMELSVSMASMNQATGQAWVAFLKALSGIVNVFQFPSAVAAAFPETLTTDGTTQRVWRLKANQVKWTIKAGKIYGLTFEVREAT
jgi:hypothetical protein